MDWDGGAAGAVHRQRGCRWGRNFGASIVDVTGSDRDGGDDADWTLITFVRDGASVEVPTRSNVCACGRRTPRPGAFPTRWRATPCGQLPPLPGATPGSEEVTTLETRLKTLKGKLLVTDATSTHVGDPQHAGGKWDSKRLGFDAPDSMVALLQSSTFEVMAAYRIIPSVFRPGDGAGQREAWRQILFGTIAPLGRAVERELRAKLDAPGLLSDRLEGTARQRPSRTRKGVPVHDWAEAWPLRKPPGWRG